MTPRSPSVGFRAVLALGLMIGFYALALGLAGSLLWVPYAALNYAYRIPAKLALGCLVGGIVMTMRQARIAEATHDEVRSISNALVSAAPISDGSRIGKKRS